MHRALGEKEIIMTAVLILTTVLQLAWTEGFETQDCFPPDHWMITNSDAYNAFFVRSNLDAHSGSASASCAADLDGLASNRDYLITPQVLPESSTGDTLVRFWFRSSSSTPCTLDILSSTSSPPSLPSFGLLAEVEVTQTSWTEQAVTLGPHSGTPVFLAFRIRSVPAGATFYLDDITLPPATDQPVICKGLLRTKTDPDQKYLHVWGSHYEMGYAHGYLLGEESKANLERFAIGSTSFHWWTPDEYENDILPYFRTYYTVPPQYMDEATGLYDGIMAKGVDSHHSELGRDITVEDILCVNAVGDFQGFNCSSVSGWGESTADDDTLSGGLVIARNFEFPTGQHASLANTSLIAAFSPDSADEQEFFTVTFAGYIGCASGINCNGLGCCIDNGNHADMGGITPGSLIPFNFSLRNAIETVDPDNNGINDIFDIDYSIEHSASRYTYDVHLFSPNDLDHAIPAAILEINNVGDSLRFVSDNSLAPAILSAWNLVVTNHHRVLYPPIACIRYQRMADSLNMDFHLDTKRALAIENAVAWWIPMNLTGTVHQMAIRPNVLVYHSSWPCIAISYATMTSGAHARPKHYYSWDELFHRDTEPPNAVSDLSIEAMGNDVVLSWNDPEDNVAVVEYRVYRSNEAFFSPETGNHVATTAAPAWTDPGAAGDPSVSVFYTVVARDAAWNESDPSNYVGAATFQLN